MKLRFAWVGLLLIWTKPSLAASQNPWDLTLDQMLLRVQEFHRPDAGPWAVAGFRMGSYALRWLKLKPYGFNFVVTHYSPLAVQYTCMVDGLQAATGASLGKLNLRLVETTVDKLHTEITTEAGEKLTLAPTGQFIQKYLDLPYEQLQEKAREAGELKDEEILRVVNTHY